MSPASLKDFLVKRPDTKAAAVELTSLMLKHIGSLEDQNHEMTLKISHTREDLALFGFLDFASDVTTYCNRAIGIVGRSLNAIDASADPAAASREIETIVSDADLMAAYTKLQKSLTNVTRIVTHEIVLSSRSRQAG